MDWSKEKLKDSKRFDKILAECLARTEKVYDGLHDKQDICDHLFISKSIGTVVATAFAKEKGLKVKQICFTPLEYIDDYIEDGNGIIFYGDGDPYADPDQVAAICKKRKLEAHCFANANHSLETGDVVNDIENIQKVMKRVDEVI